MMVPTKMSIFFQQKKHGLDDEDDRVFYPIFRICSQLMRKGMMGGHTKCRIDDDSKGFSS